MLTALLYNEVFTLGTQTELTAREALSGILGVVSLTIWFFLLVSHEPPSSYGKERR